MVPASSVAIGRRCPGPHRLVLRPPATGSGHDRRPDSERAV